MKKKNNILTIAIIAILIIAGLVIFSRYKKISPINTSPTKTAIINIQELKKHTSQDLKISFEYPNDWYVDDRNYTVLLTNYLTSLNSNDHPNSNQIEIIIREASLCQDTIEKNLIYGGCGENQKILNKILNKQIQALSSGAFYKYTVQYPGHPEQMFYFLQKGDNILKLSKQPDPSQFEKEFDDIVNSITFL